MGKALRRSLQLFKPHAPKRWHPEGTVVLTTPQYKCPKHWHPEGTVVLTTPQYKLPTCTRKA